MGRSGYGSAPEVKRQNLVLLDSTTATLAGDGTYTSTALNLVGYGSIVLSVLADQNGSLYVEQSQDATNWDVSSLYEVELSVSRGLEVKVVAPYGRVRYINGALDQAAFRLYTRARVI